jgi:hypothetical protein
MGGPPTFSIASSLIFGPPVSTAVFKYFFFFYLMTGPTISTLACNLMAEPSVSALKFVKYRKDHIEAIYNQKKIYIIIAKVEVLSFYFSHSAIDCFVDLLTKSEGLLYELKSYLDDLNSAYR